MRWGWQMQDVTNQYILEAPGAALTLVLLLWGLVLPLGWDMHYARSITTPVKHACLGHRCIPVRPVSIYFAVSYFGQIIMLWYLNLAMAGSLPSVLQDFDDGIDTAAKESPNECTGRSRMVSVVIVS